MMLLLKEKNDEKIIEIVFLNTLKIHAPKGKFMKIFLNLI
jgi:hypothetical protein